MNTIQDLQLNYEIFLDKTTAIYGETRSGKSCVIIDILKQLNDHADQIIVFSPMDRTNETYSKNIVPLPCIHYKVTDEILINIWERQEVLGSVYTRANKEETINNLFNKIPNIDHVKSTIKNINDKCRNYKKELEEGGMQESVVNSNYEDMRLECEKLIHKIKKQFINENMDIINTFKLSAEEKFSLKYINLNPRLVLIFDDCTDIMKKIKTHSVIQKLFYQGRWNFISTIIACHTDKALEPELKKNAFVQIFTEPTCAHAYFGRLSNDLDKEAKATANSASKQAFTPTAKYQKLAYVRENKKFYKFTADLNRDFKFGCDAMWNYCKKIEAREGAISCDNKFSKEFF
jgi:hypothetical protein